MRFLASLLAFALLVLTSYTLVFGAGAGPFVDLSVEAPASLARTFGVELFTRYLLPFQVTGFMLLIAMVGIIVITKKDETEGGAR